MLIEFPYLDLWSLLCLPRYTGSSGTELNHHHCNWISENFFYFYGNFDLQTLKIQYGLSHIIVSICMWYFITLKSVFLYSTVMKKVCGSYCHCDVTGKFDSWDWSGSILFAYILISINNESKYIRGQKYLIIALVLQDEWLTTFTHPANSCLCPLKVYAIKNISE